MSRSRRAFLSDLGMAMLVMAVDESQAFAQESSSQEFRSKKHLFADGGAVASSDGVTRVWTAAKKANEGRPLRFWQRDQQGNRVPLKAAIYASAIYDDKRGVFQMWCRVFPGLPPGTALEGTEVHKFMRYGYCSPDSRSWIATRCTATPWSERWCGRATPIWAPSPAHRCVCDSKSGTRICIPASFGR